MWRGLVLRRLLLRAGAADRHAGRMRPAEPSWFDDEPAEPAAEPAAAAVPSSPYIWRCNRLVDVVTTPYITPIVVNKQLIDNIRTKLMILGRLTSPPRPRCRPRCRTRPSYRYQYQQPSWRYRRAAARKSSARLLDATFVDIYGCGR